MLEKSGSFTKLDRYSEKITDLFDEEIAKVQSTRADPSTAPTMDVLLSHDPEVFTANSDNFANTAISEVQMHRTGASTNPKKLCLKKT